MIVGPIQFDQPQWLLLLLPALALVLWFGRGSISGLSGATRWLAIGVRVAVVLAVVGAIADPQRREVHDAVSVIALADLSDSMPRATEERLRDYLAEAARRGRAGDERIGIVTIAKSPQAQLLPRGSARPSRELEGFFGAGRLDAGDRTGTSIADAIRLAVAMKPDDAAQRILLISDGNETQGSALEAARATAGTGVVIDVLPAQRDVVNDVVFEDLVAPSTGRVGQTVSVHASLSATTPTRGTLELYLDGRPLDLSPGAPSTSGAAVSLNRGANRFSYPVVLREDGPLAVTGRFVPEGGAGERSDAIVQNNLQAATTFVSGEGRVLIVTNDTGASSMLASALRGRDIAVDMLSPELLPESLIGLQAYDAVIMQDTPQGDYTVQQQRDLAAYVHETGGGLLMVGGPDSFGAGGWINTPIAEILPVRLDPPAKRQLPRGALAIVVDNSGSMSSGVGGIGQSQLQLAKEGAVAAMRTLTPRDLVAFIRFDTRAHAVVPLTEASNMAEIERAIRRVTSGGGTYMPAGIELAIEEIAGSPVSVGHIVALSDGVTGGDAQTMQRLVERARAANITISTVSIGDFANDPLMQQIASSSGGTFHQVTIANGGVAQLPEILIKEAQMVSRSLIWEGEPINPVVTGPGAAGMRGFRGLPPVTGYVVTAERGGTAQITATVQTDPDIADPLVAQWQHGLGRVVAFTSDATTRWSTAWVDWASFQSFWEQHVRWAMRPAGSANISIVTSNDGDRTNVEITALDNAGEPINFAGMRGRLASEGAGTRSSRPITFTQTGPGRYTASFDSSEPGTHLLAVSYNQMVGTDEAGTPIVESGFSTAAVNRPFADEFRAREPDDALLARIAAETGGRVLTGDPAADELFARDGLEKPVALTSIWLPMTILGVVLFLLDVGVRRVRLSPAAVYASVKRSVKRATETKTITESGSLLAARAKAQDRMGPSAAAARAAAKAESRAAANRRAVKFEASSEQIASAPRSAVDRARPAPIVTKQRTEAGGGVATADDEGGGMSRLLAAKRRAASDMNEGKDGTSR